MYVSTNMKITVVFNVVSLYVMIFLSPTLFPNYLLALLFGFDSSLNSVHEGILKNWIGSCTTLHATFESLEKDKKQQLEKTGLLYLYMHVFST